MLKVAPNQLVIVEGLSYANDMSMIRGSPIKLAVDNKLVYSFHMYAWQSVTSFESYDAFVAGINENVAYILEEGHNYTAPLWLGEFGQDTSDDYWQYTIRWLRENPRVGFAQWAWNGYKTTPGTDESYGIMN